MDIQIPASHNADPVTSHMAENGINRSGKRQANIKTIHSFLSRHPGYTAAEMARDIPNIDAVEVRRRLSDMKGLLAIQGEPRKCAVAMKKTVTWYPARTDER